MLIRSPLFREKVSQLAAALRARCAGVELHGRAVWHPYPLRVIDCALAVDLDADRVTLHGAAYRTDVAARVNAFGEAHPEVQTLTDLRDLVGAYATPSAFARSTLGGTRAGTDLHRGAVVRGLVDHLLHEQHVYSEAPDEATRLAMWARCAIGEDAPMCAGDPVLVRAASFRYLRFLFGAPVMVQGAHLRCFVRALLGDRARPFDAEDLLGEAAAEASLPLVAVDDLLRTDRARGHAWTVPSDDTQRTDAVSPSRNPAWRLFFNDALDVLEQYAATRRMDARDVVRLHEHAPCAIDGIEHAVRGDFLAATNALAPYSGGLCFADLAAGYLRAFYNMLLGRPFDVEATLAAAHQQTVRLLRHLRDGEPPAEDALMRCLHALVDCSGAQIPSRDRREV
jgi:hypothetical protein